MHALTNQHYQETITLKSVVIGTFQPMALFGYICCQSNPAIQTPLWLELVQGWNLTLTSDRAHVAH